MGLGRGNFVLLLIVGLISLVLGILFIPKREVNKKNTYFFKRIYTYLQIAKSYILYTYNDISCTRILVFIGIAPILYMQDLGVTLEYFGLYQGAMAALFSIMSFSSGYCFKKFGIRNCFYFGVIFIILFLLGNSILVVYNISNPLTITIVTLLLSLGMIYPISILWPLLLEAIPDGKARMTAIFTSARLILTAFGLQLVGFLRYFYPSWHYYIHCYAIWVSNIT